MLYKTCEGVNRSENTKFQLCNYSVVCIYEMCNPTPMHHAPD